MLGGCARAWSEEQQQKQKKALEKLPRVFATVNPSYTALRGPCRANCFFCFCSLMLLLCPNRRMTPIVHAKIINISSSLHIAPNLQRVKDSITNNMVMTVTQSTE